jgi:hypothetical protein
MRLTMGLFSRQRRRGEDAGISQAGRIGQPLTRREGIGPQGREHSSINVVTFISAVENAKTGRFPDWETAAAIKQTTEAQELRRRRTSKAVASTTKQITGTRLAASGTGTIVARKATGKTSTAAATTEIN